MLLDRHRTGTAAQSLGALSMAAQGVRDQLSEDVWMVLADIERALAALAANPYDQGLQLTDASERVLSGLLALAGIVSENMVRDPGWYMLDSGRGLERALQVLALLRVTICRRAGGRHGSAGAGGGADRGRVDRHLPSPLPRPSRGRGGGRAAGASTRSTRARSPTSCSGSGPTCGRCRTRSPTARPLRLLDAWSSAYASPTRSRSQSPQMAVGRRSRSSLPGCRHQLRALSEAIRDQYQQPPPTQQPLFRTDALGGTA